LEKIMSMSKPLGSEDPDLDTIEARSEELRSGLADTVGELRNRLSPDTIKADVKDHIAQTGQDILAKLERSARANPLQTAAIGAGLAYPLIGLLRSIPAPILLMGAGVALSGRGNLFAGLISGDKVSDAVSAGTEKAAGLANVVSAKASDAASSVSSSVQSVTDRAGSMVDAASMTVSDAVSGVSRSATETADAAARLARTTYHDGVNAVSDTTDRAVALGRQGRDTVIDTVQRHPLMVGALTALAGAALAALIPASRTESRLFGKTSSRLKERASSTAYEGMHAAMDAGERVLGSTVDAARDEGLDADAGRDAIRDVTDRAGAVVDAAVKAVVPKNETDEPVVDRPATI
jgi:ElaB/YqjD/DUF883 family membrane-anchored ribosome-binding protein